mgnify:CR=1 FL=1
MLILFDIDGTLLVTRSAGVHAMADAGRELFGDQFSVEGIDFSGRLDCLIWKDLVTSNAIADGDANHERFRITYGKHLHRRLHETSTATLLPGVHTLVHRLAEKSGLTLGLLTGNYPETGRLKVQTAGLDPDLFTIAAWGIDGATRRDLPPVAIRRHHEASGRAIDPEQVVIIGDTPHDIDCARHNGCRSLGVATGAFDRASLHACGADLAVNDLSDTGLVVDWLWTQPAAMPKT